MIRRNFPIYEGYTILNPIFIVSGNPSAFTSITTLSWGTQKRLGRWGYFDFYTGLSYRTAEIRKRSLDQRRLEIIAGIMIGLGL